MKAKKYLAALLAMLLLATVLAGCGADTELSEAGSAANSGGQLYDNAESEDTLVKTGETSQTTTPVNQKLIRTIYLEAETEDMDALLSSVDARIAALGGYVESRKVNNGRKGSGTSRTATLTIRIPAEFLDQFVDQVRESSNIISHTESAEDVTLAYSDTQSRITALETEEARLLELLAMAETLEDVLTLEEKLTDVRTQLETARARLRVYDNLVDYGTIHLSIEEVEVYTEEVEEEPEKTVWQRMGDGFNTSAKLLGTILTELLIFLVALLPLLLPLAVIAGVVLLILWLRKRKLKKRLEKLREKKAE